MNNNYDSENIPLIQNANLENISATNVTIENLTASNSLFSNVNIYNNNGTSIISLAGNNIIDINDEHFTATELRELLMVKELNKQVFPEKYI